MKKKNGNEKDDELRPEYDLVELKNPVQGKYATRYQKALNQAIISKNMPHGEAKKNSL